MRASISGGQSPGPYTDTAGRRNAGRDGFLACVKQRRALMGIINVTPDSFSDGGRFVTPEAACEQAQTLVADGADILDIGAESTRPGFTPVPADEEWARLAPVLPCLVDRIEAPVSIDTTKASVAERALAAGVCVVNDIWGLQRDPDMAAVAAAYDAAVVVMHNRDTRDPAVDIVADMHRFFERALTIASRAGIPTAHVILDPGIGFGKTKEQNIAALRAVPALAVHGCPILIGVSRKSLFGDLLGAAPGDRLVGTLAANLATAASGARIFRVHDVREHRMALAVFDALGL